MMRASRYIVHAMLALVIIGVGVLFGLPDANAQEGTQRNITISPSSVQLSIAPGGSVTKNFTVFNSGDDPFTVTVSIAPYRVEGEEYTPKFTALPGAANPSEWVKVSDDTPEPISLAPGSYADVAYTVNVPAATAPGGYYVTILAETGSSEEDQAGIVVHNRVGNILYINVEGDVKTVGSLSGEKTPPFIVGDVVSADLLVKNSGGTHFLAKTNVVINNVFGAQVYTASFERYVLPQTERRVPIDWAVNAPIGIYHISRSAVVAGDTKTLADVTVFIIQPWLLWAIVILIALIALLIPLLRRKKKQTKTDKTE